MTLSCYFYLTDHPDDAWVVTWGVRDETQVEHVQGKYSTLFISPWPPRIDLFDKEWKLQLGEIIP